MSRDDDDDDFSPPKPAPHIAKPVDELSRFILNGKLTEKGKEQARIFGVRELIYDTNCLLDWSLIFRAFETWRDPRFKDKYGFSLETLEEEEEIEDAIRSIHNLRRWSEEDLSDDDIPRVRNTAYTHESGLRARFRDQMGVEMFDPDENEADAAVAYLVNGLLPLQGVNMFVALPETLKSWLAFSVAISVSKGLPALGRFHVLKARTIVFDWEVGSREIKRRFRLLGANESIAFKSHSALKLTDEQFWIELEKLRPEFVVIDSLSAGSGAEFGELDSRFAEPLSRAARFAEMHRCTFLFLHHSPKAASAHDVESLFRGTGAIRSKVDSAFYFRRLPTGSKGEERAEITCVKSRKGGSAERFVIQLTNEHGVELFEGGTNAASASPPPLTDEDKVLHMIKAEPNVSGNRLATELEMRRETVSAILDTLEKAGRIRRDGKGRNTGYSVAESFPESLPVERNGNDSGNDGPDTEEKP